MLVTTFGGGGCDVAVVEPVAEVEDRDLHAREGRSNGEDDRVAGERRVRPRAWCRPIRSGELLGDGLVPGRVLDLARRVAERRCVARAGHRVTGSCQIARDGPGEPGRSVTVQHVHIGSTRWAPWRGVLSELVDFGPDAVVVPNDLNCPIIEFA